VFLGSSIQCAECHNHKYDPFTQREYYQLYDFFNRIPEKGLDSDPAPPFIQVPTARQEADLKALQESVRTLEASHTERLSVKSPEWDSAQTAWETAWLAGTELAGVLQLGPWRRVGPFVEPDGKVAFEREFGPEKEFQADAVFGNGAVNIVNFSCGTAFTCTFANLSVDPFLNPGVDVGIANNGVLVPLASILSPTSGPPPVQADNPLPFDFGNVLTTLVGQTDQVLQGNAGQEMLLMPLGRRLTLCR
jgi:hypothetical protein